MTARGDVLAHEVVPIATDRLDDGGAVQDPDAWWDAIVSAGSRLVARGALGDHALVGVTCTGQWGSTVPVAADGTTAGPCLLWFDSRGHAHSARVLGSASPLTLEGYGLTKVLRFIRKTAGAPAIEGNDPLGHVLFLRNDMPDVDAATAVYLEPVDFLTLRFTGRAAATPASMILSWLVDARDVAHPRYAPDLVRLSTRDAAKLPELLPTGSVVGTVTRSVAEAIGIPPGIPVVAGTPDLLSGCMGSGAIGDLEAHMALSTTAWLSCHVPKKKTDPFRQLATVPGVRDDRYLVANNHETAGACLEWVRRELFAGASFSELDSAVSRAEAGSGGILFAPWLAGERCPVNDRTLRGSFLNVSLQSTRAQMLRAVFEGVALNARWMQDATEHFVGRRLGAIRVIGGGASSDIWCQIHADVMERPIEKVADPLVANVRGAALFAAHRLGLCDLDAAAREVRVERTFVPNPATGTVYRALYAEFHSLYRRQRKMYARLNGLGGPFAASPAL